MREKTSTHLVTKGVRSEVFCVNRRHGRKKELRLSLHREENWVVFLIVVSKSLLKEPLKNAL